MSGACALAPHSTVLPFVGTPPSTILRGANLLQGLADAFSKRFAGAIRCEQKNSDFIGTNDSKYAQYFERVRQIALEIP